MPGIIILQGQEAATNTDILQGTRLQNAPARGTMTFELAASDNNATNRFTATIQLPNGDTPLNAVQVPQGTGTAGVAGVLDDRLALIASFPVQQGGHVVFSCTETGDTELTWRVTFTPG